MDQIRPWLYIGAYRDTLNLSYLAYKSIGAMLQLAEPVKQPDIDSLYLPVQDLAPVSEKHLRTGLDFVHQQKECGRRILIACGAGINRSSAFCTAALKEAEGLPLLQAFQEVRRRHPESMPHPPVWESLCQYYVEPTPYLEVMRLSLG